MHSWADRTINEASKASILGKARETVIKKTCQRWRRVQVVAFYKAECLQRMIPEVLRQQLKDLKDKEKKRKENQELESEGEEEEREQEQQGSREKVSRATETRGDEEEQTNGDEERKADGHGNKQNAERTKTKARACRTVTCTRIYCHITRRLGKDKQLRTGTMIPGTNGCFRCTRFRRMQKMIRAAEKPAKTRVSKIAKLANRIIYDEDVWTKPTREGSCKTLAENQTSGAKHLANTILVNIGSTWSGPDAKLSDRKRLYLEKASMITCDGNCKEEAETDTDAEDEEELPAICKSCKHLLRMTDHSMEGESGKCKVCGEDTDSEKVEICRACQILWLIKENSMETQIKPYLQDNPSSTNTDAERSNPITERSQENGRRKSYSAAESMYTNPRAESARALSKKKKRQEDRESEMVGRQRQLHTTEHHFRLKYQNE